VCGDETGKVVRKIVRYVDVPGEKRLTDDPQLQTETLSLGAVTNERTWPVREPETGVCGNAGEVGPVFATVGHECDARETGESCEAGSKWEIAVHYENLFCSGAGESVDTGGDGTVQTEPRLFQKHCTVFEGPGGHFGVVTDDSGSQGRCGGEDVLCHRSRKLGSLGGTQSGSEPSLCGGEALYGE
jgi:hypothetical protein